MARLYSSAYVVKVLQEKGFLYISQKGSHVKFRKSQGNKIYTVIVPVGQKEIPKGTFSSILRQARLKEKDFKKS